MSNCSGRPKIIQRQRTTPPTTRYCQNLKRIILFLPLTVLLLERIWVPFENVGRLGGYLDVEHVAATSRLKSSYTPATILSTTSTSLGPYSSLEKITTSNRLFESTTRTCPTGTRRIENTNHLDRPSSRSMMQNRTIPMIVHLHAPSRCVPNSIFERANKWKFDNNGWSFFLHDDLAIRRLLLLQATLTTTTTTAEEKDFPQLAMVMKHCLDSDFNSSNNKGSINSHVLWQFLVLYVYGGVYVDMSMEPQNEDFRHGKIGVQGEDAILFRDKAKKNHKDDESSTPVLLSPLFLATSPRHPLMFYSVHHTLLEILDEKGSKLGNQQQAQSLASRAMQRAWMDFQGHTEGKDKKKVKLLNMAGHVRQNVKHPWTRDRIGKHDRGNVAGSGKTCLQKMAEEVISAAAGGGAAG